MMISAQFQRTSDQGDVFKGRDFSRADETNLMNVGL